MLPSSSRLAVLYSQEIQHRHSPLEQLFLSLLRELTAFFSHLLEHLQEFIYYAVR
jgi:hypothetical protein